LIFNFAKDFAFDRVQLSIFDFSVSYGRIATYNFTTQQLVRAKCATDIGCDQTSGISSGSIDTQPVSVVNECERGYG